MRITSVAPRWEWLPLEKALMIHNPIDLTKAAFYFYRQARLEEVRPEHEDWFLNYAIARAKKILGSSVRSKFGNTLPGPARDMTLNGTELAAEAKEEITQLEADLLTMQHATPPIIG